MVAPALSVSRDASIVAFGSFGCFASARAYEHDIGRIGLRGGRMGGVISWARGHQTDAAKGRLGQPMKALASRAVRRARATPTMVILRGVGGDGKPLLEESRPVEVWSSAVDVHPEGGAGFVSFGSWAAMDGSIPSQATTFRVP